MNHKIKHLLNGALLILFTAAACTRAQVIPDTKSLAAATQVIVEEPTLDPPAGDLCTTFWYEYTNNRSHKAYLTLNVNTTTSSTNHADWRPTLPQTGMYRVEAYIPSHAPVEWTCPVKTISQDTTQARYTIYHTFGASSVTVSQSPLQNEWLPLGEFYFTEGQTGYVHLTDLNGETSLSTTISFSAMRFTYIGPPPQVTFLPNIGNQVKVGISVDQVWSTGAAASPRTAFVPGETIRYYVTGTSTTSTPILMNWTQTGPCGTTTLFNGYLTLGPGTWTAYTYAAAPSCLGVYSFSVTANDSGEQSSSSGSFVVSNPTSVNITNRQAFDICALPTPAQMQTWWNASPYFVFNLYIGGIHRAKCAGLENLNAFWVNSVRQQGWWFIPTWVGPQAACSRYTHKINMDTTTAYYQGRSEADLALEAATNLGLGGSTIIYYDLEAYAPADTACRESTKAFMNGWVQRLHERGAKAGGYGGPRSSYMEDWAFIPNVPDDVWIAAWYPQPYYYDPNATVWTSALSNNLWSNHQRLRQYAGDHAETWGGLTLRIDSNATDGEVAVVTGSFITGLEPGVLTGPPQVDLPPNLQIDPPAVVAEPTHAKSLPETQLRTVQLVGPGEGWALKGGHLLWTSDRGQVWKDITPSGLKDAPILNAHFIDNRRGWLVFSSPKTGQLMALKTSSSGSNWEASVVTSILDPDTMPIHSVQIDFIDENRGWMAIRLQTGINFSQGLLYSTTDGGKTWQPRTLPVGGSVNFIDRHKGWLLGGPGSSDLYFTQDGGNTWTPQMPAGTSLQRNASVFYSLPVFENDQQGMLAVTVVGEVESTAEVYVTTNGGITWQLRSAQPLKAEVPPGTALPMASNKAGEWYLVMPDSTELVELKEGGRAKSLLTSSGLPKGVTSVNFSGAYGWAQATREVCQGTVPAEGDKTTANTKPFTCEQSVVLLQTTDGGQTWVEITP